MTPPINWKRPWSTDLKAEVLLWVWMEEGMLWSQVTVHPAGSFARAYSRDVRRIWAEEPAGHNWHLHLEVNRDGLYDALPEGLFHQPARRKPNRDAAEVIEEIRVQKEKEAAARKFFLPLEQEFYHLRVLLTAGEQRQYSRSPDSERNQALVDFWEIPDFFDAQQMHYLFHLLPVVYQLVGDQEAVTQCFQLFVEDNVTLVTGYGQPTRIDSGLLPLLGSAVLGVDAVADGLYGERVLTTEITISLPDDLSLLEYLPGGRKWRIVGYLSRYLLPCESEISIRPEVSSPHAGWQLLPAGSAGRLGYTSVLG
jgi:hypothetical protein